MARLYVALAALLFSTGGAAIKLSSLTSWQIAGLRSGIAAAVLALLLPGWRGFSLRTLTVGVTFAATMILFVTANTLTTAASAIFLQTTAPLYVLALGPLLLHEPPRRSDFPVAGLLGVGAVLFLVGTGEPLATAPNPGAGNAVAAVSGLTWALTVVGLRWLGRGPWPRGGDPAGNAVLLGNVLAFLVCLPLGLPLRGATGADWAIVGYLGVVQIGVAYMCLVRGVRGARAVDVALLLVLEPVMSTILAWAVHGEAPGRWGLLGSALIVVGLLVQATRVGERSSRPNAARTVSTP
jgi:drug/metabolite transporter, DME family